jgi:putative methionine-R-sulfoxide reductase with GAF domain
VAYTSIVIIDAKSSQFTVRVALEQRYDVNVQYTQDPAAGLELVQSTKPNYILVNPDGIQAELTAFLMRLARSGSQTPIIVAGDPIIADELRKIYPHIMGNVPSAYSEIDLLPFLKRQRPGPTVKPRSMALAERAALVQANQLLEQRVQEVMTLHRIGKSVAALIDLDAILTRIVEAAVFMLRAEEGSIMLVDPETNALYLRAQKGLGEKQAQGLNIKIQDTLIGSVVRTKRPVRLTRGSSENSLLKVVTGYLVNALLYVPLILHDQVIGVLGVSNQTAPQAFTDHDQRLMESLADYAALAIEVARQHKTICRMRQDLAVVHTIGAAVDELRERLPAADADVTSALRRIEGAVHILARLAETEATADV